MTFLILFSKTVYLLVNSDIALPCTPQLCHAPVVHQVGKSFLTFFSLIFLLSHALCTPILTLSSPNFTLPKVFVRIDANWSSIFDDDSLVFNAISNEMIRELTPLCALIGFFWSRILVILEKYKGGLTLNYEMLWCRIFLEKRYLNPTYEGGSMKWYEYENRL